MKDMKMKYGLLKACGGVLLSVWINACDPEVLAETRGQPVAGDDPGRTELPVRIGSGTIETKTSLLNGVESVGSGALVLVFRTDSGLLDSYCYYSQEELQGQDTTPLRLSVPLVRCDFFILGNLTAIGKSNSRSVPLPDALGETFPSTEADLEAFVYRLDGGALNADYRRERFSEVAQYGIPYVHIQKNVDVVRQAELGQGIPGSENCRRLFSKVTVRIDHSRLDGNGVRPQAFVNRKLYLRQANGRLQPFSDAGQKAQEMQDVLAESDYDPDMVSSNASVTVYSFYVPENLQGTLLPGNTDNRKKTPEALAATSGKASIPYLTYVELSARLDPAQSGYGGDVTYRFYVGKDNCSNFDLERGREYNIHLTFRAGSLFSPDWSVGVEGWEDHRLFCLTADPVYQTILPDQQLVAVRVKRPGVFYLYANPSGKHGAENALLGGQWVAPSVQSSFSPNAITDYAFTGALFSPGTSEAEWLSARGIHPDYDGGTGRITLTVTDAVRFNTHIGDEASFGLRLLPGGSWLHFKVRLVSDLGASLSGSGDFYLGQKRTASVSGMTGSVFYRGDGEHWNTAPVPGAVSSGDHPYTGAIPVYGTYPGQTGVTFISSDSFNDDPQTLKFNVLKPVLQVGAASVWLPFDGSEQNVGVGYYTADGSTFMPPECFDNDCWSSFLQPAVYCESQPQWSDCVGADFHTGQMYLVKTSNAYGNIEDCDYRITGYSSSIREKGFSLGYIHVYNPTLELLYPNNSSGCRISGKVSKLALGELQSLSGWHGSKLRSDGTFGVGYYYEVSSGGSLVNQITDDCEFGITFPYAYPGADPGNIVWNRTGASKTWTSSHGESFGPVITYDISASDSGSGGAVLWKYVESAQAKSDSYGEPVPGGLLVPYGEQRVTATVKNKWDSRSYSESASFTPTYEIISCSFFVTARSGAAAAKVYPLPRKVIKYLYAMGTSLNRSQRQEMIRLFDQGTGYWPGISGAGLYRKDPYIQGHFLTNVNSAFPHTDFQARYLSQYKYGNQSSTIWSYGLMNALKTCPYYQVMDNYILKKINHTTEVRIETVRNNEGLIFSGTEEYL